MWTRWKCIFLFLFPSKPTRNVGSPSALLIKHVHHLALQFNSSTNASSNFAEKSKLFCIKLKKNPAKMLSKATLCPGNLSWSWAGFSLLSGCPMPMPNCWDCPECSCQKSPQPNLLHCKKHSKVSVREFKCGWLWECKWQILETGFHCLLLRTANQLSQGLG